MSVKELLTVDQDVLLGISGGLLSLVGLIAIFISINSQHSIEKARDILLNLELFQIENRKTNLLTAKKVRNMLDQYNRLIKLSGPTKIVIFIAIVTILFVGFSWVINLNGYFVWVSFILILFFTVCLWMLTKVSIVGALPNPIVFKDINTVYNGIRMTDLFAMSLQFLVKTKFRRIDEIALHSTIEMRRFLGFKISVSFYKDEKFIERKVFGDSQVARRPDNNDKSSQEIKEFSPRSILILPLNQEEKETIEFNNIEIDMSIYTNDGMLKILFKNEDFNNVDDFNREIFSPVTFHFVSKTTLYDNKRDRDYDFTELIY